MRAGSVSVLSRFRKRKAGERPVEQGKIKPRALLFPTYSRVIHRPRLKAEADCAIDLIQWVKLDLW